MGRGPFFGGARKMRGFPMNLSPGGLDEAGFPYFGHDGKFGFPYGEAPFHSHADAPFFAGHPIGPMPFNSPGKSIISTRLFSNKSQNPHNAYNIAILLCTMILNSDL